jgi:hypothetical protein
MQLLDLPLAIGFGVPADAGIEGARHSSSCFFQTLDLVGMDLVPLAKSAPSPVPETASNVFAFSAASILRLVFVMVCTVASAV